jgi:hypothetical protein
MYNSHQEQGILPDFKTAIMYTEMYSKVMGLESGFLIDKVKMTFKGDQQAKDAAVVEFQLDPKSHFLYYRNFGYLVSPC